MPHDGVLLVTNVKAVEQEINALYQILTYTLPLLASFVIAALAVFYRITQATKRNAQNTADAVKLANGQLSNLQASVQEIKHGQIQDRARADGADISS